MTYRIATATGVQKPRKPHARRPHLSPLERIVAHTLLVEKRTPAALIAAAFQISLPTARRLRNLNTDEIAA